MAENTNLKEASVETFRHEVLNCWRHLPDKALFFVLLGAWAALFQFLGNSVFGYIDTASLFKWTYHIFDTSPDDEHGKLIPFAVVVLLWWKRQELLAVPKRIWWPALILLVLGALLHVFGYVIQFPNVSVVGFFVGLYGLTGVIWGRGWLETTFFPMILFIFCVPLGTLSDSITFPMRMLVTKISVGIADSFLGIPVIRDGSQIRHAQDMFTYEVAAACSGIRSLISLLALTTIYGFLTFKTLWKRVIIIAVAFPLAIVGNVARITTVIVAAEAFGQDAGAFVENKLGFITFAVAISCILLLGYLLREGDGSTAIPLEPKTA